MPLSRPLSNFEPRRFIGNEDFIYRSEQLAALAVRYAVPTISRSEFAAAGGLMSYGGNITDGYVRLASIPAEFSRARSRPTYRSTSPQKLS